MLTDGVYQVNDHIPRVERNTGDADISTAAASAFYKIPFFGSKARGNYVTDLTGHTPDALRKLVALYLGGTAVLL